MLALKKRKCEVAGQYYISPAVDLAGILPYYYTIHTVSLGGKKLPQDQPASGMVLITNQPAPHNSPYYKLNFIFVY